MKKIFSLFAAVLFAGSMLAADAKVVLDFTDAGWGFPKDYVKTEQSYTNGGYTITLGASNNGHKYLTNQGDSLPIGLIFGKQGATLALPAFDFAVGKIVVTGLANASGKVTTNIYVGEDAVSTEITGSKEVNTFAIAADKQAAGNVFVLKVTNANNAQAAKIEIFEAGEEDVPGPVLGAWKEIFFKAATAVGAFNDSVFAVEGFELKCIDTENSKIKTTSNKAYFGIADEFSEYNFRLQTSGKSSSKNSLLLTIPGDGFLRVAVRSGNNDDTTRTVVLSQGADTLYNKAVKEADAIKVAIDDSTNINVYPYIIVPVKKGEVSVGYPVNAVNFYSFAFLAGAAPDTIPTTAPDTITCAKAAEDALAGKTDEVVVKGYVTEIATEWSAQYKNISFWMADAKDGGKVFEAFRAVCEKEADAPIVGDLVAAAGKLTKYNETPELAAGCTFTIIEKAPRPEPKPTVIADTITVAKAIELGMKLDSMATDTVIYAVEGYVINAGSVSLTYMNQSWYMADEATAAASDFQAYNCYAIDGNDTLKVLNGDKVQLVGKLKKYYNKTEQKYIIEIEKGNASFISKTEGDHSIKVVTEEVTVAQALEIGAALADNAVTEKQYKITAYVSAVNVKSSDAYSDQYGNQSFWIADDQSSTASTNADGAFYVYRGKPSTAKEIALGSKVEFICTIKKYVPAGGGDPVIENADQNILITVLEEPAGPELPDGVISCDSAVALAKTIEDPVEVKSTVEGPQVKVWGYVTYAYNASEKDGIVTQSAWLSDVKDSNSGVIQGAYLEIASMEAAVVKGDYVQLEGTLAKYLKEGKDGKPNEIVIEVINGKMAKVSELGIENIELTVKAQKVIVDGVLYIIRDNKMYNVQGLQVR